MENLNSTKDVTVVIHAVIEDWADSGDYGQDIKLFTDVDEAQSYFKELLKKQDDDRFSLKNRWRERNDYEEEYIQKGYGCEDVMIFERFACNVEDYETRHYELKLQPMTLTVNNPQEFIKRIQNSKSA